MTLTEQHHPETSLRPTPWQVAVQLAKVESRRILLHPATLIAFAVAVYAMWALHNVEAPVLNRVSASSVLPVLIFAAGLLIATSEASMRVWKTDQSEALDVAPTPPRVRTIGLLLAALAPVLVAVAFQGAAVMVMTLDQPVTAIDLWDVLAGPVLAAWAVILGVAVGRWVPTRFTGPLTVVAMVSVLVILDMYFLRRRFGVLPRWFGPFVPLDWEPVEISFRPTREHLIYLLGLVGVFAVVALLRGPSGRRTVLYGALVASLVVVGIGVQGQRAAYALFDRATVLASYMPPQADYICARIGGVEYCALPGYERWIEEWAANVGPVLDIAPQDAWPESRQVKQYPTRLMDQGQSFELTYEPGVATGLWWSRGPGGVRQADAHKFGMSLGTAGLAVGLSSERIAGVWTEVRTGDGEGEYYLEFVPVDEVAPGVEDEISYYRYCDTMHQGRAVVALWLAGSVSDSHRQYLDNRIEGMNEWLDNGQYYPWYLWEFKIQEVYYARQLLDRPQPQVRSLVSEHWATLTDPATTTAQAVRLLGMDLLPGHEEWTELDLEHYSEGAVRCR